MLLVRATPPIEQWYSPGDFPCCLTMDCLPGSPWSLFDIFTTERSRFGGTFVQNRHCGIDFAAFMLIEDGDEKVRDTGYRLEVVTAVTEFFGCSSHAARADSR